MALFANLFVVFALIVAMSSEACSSPIEFSQGGMTFVEVGDPGNANTQYGNYYGAVNYSFGIGKYEVTIEQYCEFLNAVAKSDQYGLYDARMGTNLNVAGISRSGSSGAYAYSVMDNGGNSGNRPISYMSALTAMRYANWMSNGKGSGSTETGAYTLNGQTSGLLPDRNPNAGFYVPTENEWFKSAYYDPMMNNGAGGYHNFATQGFQLGNIIGSEPNQANVAIAFFPPLEGGGFAGYFGILSVTQVATYDAKQNYLTDVGAFGGSSSFYGTFDQDGNVAELSLVAGAGTVVLRGLSWNQANDHLGLRLAMYSYSRESWSGFGSNGGADITPDAFPSAIPSGFRLTHIQPVPEPSSMVLAGVGVCIGIVWHLRRRGVA